MQQVAELPFVAPFDAVLLADLGAIDTTRYKLAIVVNAFRLDSGQRDTITRTLKRDGKHIVWLYAPGYFGGDGVSGNVDGIKSVVGMTVAARPKAVGIQAKFLAGYPNAYLLDADQFVVTDSTATVLAKRTDVGRRGRHWAKGAGWMDFDSFRGGAVAAPMSAGVGGCGGGAFVS